MVVPFGRCEALGGGECKGGVVSAMIMRYEASVKGTKTEESLWGSGEVDVGGEW